MTALPIANENMSQALFMAVRQMPSMSRADLRQLLAHTAGLLAERQGVMLTAQAMGNIAVALHRGGQRPTMQEISLIVAAKYGISPAALRAPADIQGSREHHIAHPRHEAFWMARRVVNLDGTPRYSYPQIGQFFGGRDHTTVMHGVRAHVRRMAAEPAA